MVTVQKYKDTRYWAVYLNGSLLAVTVYRKGARAVADALSAAAFTPAFHYEEAA